MNKQKMWNANFNFAISVLLLITIGNAAIATLDTTWWKHTSIYEIYTPSFKDSNGDGFGDIKGIAQKLDHFVDLGTESLHITPFLKSPMADFGYDISNYTEIEPLFGTMSDFNEMMDEMKRRGLKLIMDFVINHSSDEHPWFQKSIDRIHPYTDFYVWADPKGFDHNKNPIPPNNWWCAFDGSAWEWNSKRRQFYLHQFAIKQPDFNLRNAKLLNEIKKIMKFWMDRGVAGFRFDAVKHFIEDELLRDEQLVKGKNVITTYKDLIHNYTTDLWESYEVLHELKYYIDEYSRKEQSYERIVIAEAYTDGNHTMAYYGSKHYGITHFPYNFDLLAIRHDFNASAYNTVVTNWLENMPEGATANWMVENHDNIRIGSNLDEWYMDILTITMMTLPGVACIYYGQEIGMTNGRVRKDQRKDPNNNASGPDSFRDGQRLPMQWDGTLNAGFTSTLKPWLPVNANYWKVNVEEQKSKEISRYNTFKVLSKIRKSKTMKFGSFEPSIISTWVYAFVRSLPRHEKYITILNLGSEIEHIDLHVTIPRLPPKLQVVAASLNAGYKKGNEIESKPRFPKTFPMRPESAIVLSTRIHRATSSFATQSLDFTISTNYSSNFETEGNYLDMY